jgi:hypothetical protein
VLLSTNPLCLDWSVVYGHWCSCVPRGNLTDLRQRKEFSEMPQNRKRLFPRACEYTRVFECLSGRGKRFNRDVTSEGCPAPDTERGHILTLQSSDFCVLHGQTHRRSRDLFAARPHRQLPFEPRLRRLADKFRFFLWDNLCRPPGGSRKMAPTPPPKRPLQQPRRSVLLCTGGLPEQPYRHRPFRPFRQPRAPHHPPPR